MSTEPIELCPEAKALSLLDLRPEEVDLVIYHKNCPDGTASAYLMEWHRSCFNPTRPLEFFPSPPGKAYYPDITGKNVLICDLSYDAPILKEMLEKATKLAIIDHHISAQKELVEFPPSICHFDMKHSAAMLVWYYCFPLQEPPAFVSYVEDRDIWKWEFPETAAFTLYLGLSPLDFSVFATLRDPLALQEAIQKGNVLIQYQQSIMEQLLGHVGIKFVSFRGRHYLIGILNSPILKSDLGNAILKRNPWLDFSVVYSSDEVGEKSWISLRSEREKEDVSVIAKALGGGGHRNASGITLPKSVPVLPFKTIAGGELLRVLKTLNQYEVTIGKEPTQTVVKGAIVNYPSLPYELGRYLLQERGSFEKEGKITSLQVAPSLMAIFQKEANPETELNLELYTQKFQFVVCWQVADPRKGTRKCYLILSPDLAFETLVEDETERAAYTQKAPNIWKFICTDMVETAIGKIDAPKPFQNCFLPLGETS